MAQAQEKKATPIRAPRVTLATVTKAPVHRAPRVLIHGQPGVGKTTFAADAPSPIFICPEDGIPVSVQGAGRFPAPEGGWKWIDVRDAIVALSIEKHDYKTLVIDTLDWLEPIIWEYVVDKAGVASIEEIGGGFGKGYNAALDEWRVFLSAVEKLWINKNMAIVMSAHSSIRTFKDPQSDGYDRYELKIHKYPAGLFKEWSDVVLFAQHEAAVATDKRTKRNRGVSTGARIMHTVWNAAFDAKNRYGLPEEMPLSWAELQAGIDAGAPAETSVVIAEIKRKAAEMGGELEAKTLQALERVNGDPAKLAQLNDWANGKLALATETKGNQGT